MRILYVIHQFFPEFYTGTERFLLSLASMMQTAGHHVQIITWSVNTAGNDRSNLSMVTDEYLYQSIPVLAVKHLSESSSPNLVLNDQKILEFAREFLYKHAHFDLIHIVHPMRLSSFAQAAQEIDIPYVLTLTDFWMTCARVNLKTSSGELCDGPSGGDKCARDCSEIPNDFVRDRLEQARKILHGAKAVVSPTRFLAARFKTEYPRLDILINPHGLDHNLLEPNLKSYQHGDKLIFGFCGSFLEIKGVDLLIRAFNSLKNPNAELKLFGSSFQKSQYFEQLIEAAKDNQAIQFCGSYNLEESGDVYGQFDVLVVPSVVHENYSMVTHEALACRVPVIASRVGGLPDFVVDGHNGMVFNPMSWEDLRSKMDAMLEDPTILNELKQSIAKSPPPMIEEESFFYETLYRQILDEIS